jgi:hypothetical protein
VSERERQALECIIVLAFAAPAIWNLIGAARYRTVMYWRRPFSYREEVSMRGAPLAFWTIVAVNLFAIAFLAVLGGALLLGSINR